jgi:hypothetical protein
VVRRQDPQLNPPRHGWLSRLRSYFILDPLIWAYTVVLGTISLVCSLFDRNGRIQHNLARFWSWLIMKTILSPVTITGMDQKTFDNSKPKRLCRHARVGAGYSDPLRLSPISIPHHFQE